MRFDDFCTKNILAPTLVTFHMIFIEPHAFLMLKQVIYKIDQLMGVVGWSESL